jgi:hypothetical protein
MVVSWIPLTYSEARGYITHYTVAYSPLRNEIKRQTLHKITRTVPGMDTNTTTIHEGLDADIDYIVQVSATNQAGSAEFSPPVLVTAPTETRGINVHA